MDLTGLLTAVQAGNTETWQKEGKHVVADTLWRSKGHHIHACRTPGEHRSAHCAFGPAGLEGALRWSRVRVVTKRSDALSLARLEVKK